MLPIYFVHRSLEDWPELLRDGPLPDPDQCPQKFKGRDSWITMTYLRLKPRGADLRLSPEYVPGEINLVYYDDLSLKSRPDRAFIAAIEPDRPHAAAADLRIVQNQLQVRGPTDHYMVHWPQPGLKPRDVSFAILPSSASPGTPGEGRAEGSSPEDINQDPHPNPLPEYRARGKNRLKRIGYVGLTAYLAPAFRDDAFRRQLGELGIELVIREKDWTDCRDLDAILAVRQVSEFDLGIKPPSKLINAWRAGCPALLGAEPAYQQIRKSPLDYFEIRTPQEAIAALKRLRDENGLMEKVIANGQLRSQEFSIENLAAKWEALLAGPVTQAYRKWQKESAIYRSMRFAIRAFRHKQERKRFKKLIRA